MKPRLRFNFRGLHIFDSYRRIYNHKLPKNEPPKKFIFYVFMNHLGRFCLGGSALSCIVEFFDIAIKENNLSAFKRASGMMRSNFFIELIMNHACLLKVAQLVTSFLIRLSRHWEYAWLPLSFYEEIFLPFWFCVTSWSSH